MEIKIHTLNDSSIAEIISDNMIIQSAEDGLDLLGYLYFQDFEKVIIHEKNITPDFFDLRNGMAGEILQKFSNYRMKLAIIVDFTKYSSKSLNDFMFESNKIGNINFVDSVPVAILKFSRH